MRKSILWIAIIVTALLLSGNTTLAHGQTADNTSAKTDNDQGKTAQAYRLDFSFNEVVDGKKVNTRNYTMDLMPQGGQEIKIGTRVPVVVGTGGKDSQYQYIDVGTNIEAHLNRLTDTDVELRIKCEVSNIDTTADSKIAPVIRQIKLEGATLLVVGKPLLIGSVDDPTSKRQFQLEVTVTKLR